MTMQQALQIAFAANLFARPVNDSHYSYRYQQVGNARLIHVHGRDRFGAFRSDFWRTLSQRDIECEWLVCNQAGEPVDLKKNTGPTLKDLVA